MLDFALSLWIRATAFTGMVGFYAGAAQASADLTKGGSERYPVVLIHGIFNSAATMLPMAKKLATEGWDAYTLTLKPANGKLGLPELARQVSDYVERTFPKGQKINLVGFSMGGIVCRYYLQKLGGADRVDHFVSISAPNHGTWAAYLRGGDGCLQMRPDSALLADLNGDLSALERIRMTVVWTPLDLVILPAKSSRMPVGQEMRRWRIMHPLMVLQPAGIADIVTALKNPPARMQQPSEHFQ